MVRLATRFATPAGANSCLLLDGKPIYPMGCEHMKDTYEHIHSFLGPVLWSPDSSRVAIVEKTFDWEYYDPFGAYYDGESSDVHYTLVIASLDGDVGGYPLQDVARPVKLQWSGESQLTLNGETFNLAAHPPLRLPLPPASKKH